MRLRRRSHVPNCGFTTVSKNKKRRTGRDRRLRLRLFRAGNTKCPICFSQFTQSDVVTGRATLEHAPPKALGGSAISLTCSECNNRASRIDQHAVLANRARDEWSSGRGARVEIDFFGVKTTSRYVPGNRNDPLPTRVDQLRRGSLNLKLGGLSSSQQLDGDQGIRFRIPRRSHFESVTMIRSAYLMVFSLMGPSGYNYCESTALRPVREQIMKPEKQVLTSAFVAEGTVGEGTEAQPSLVFLCHAARPPIWIVPMWNGKSVLLPCGGPEPIDRIDAEGSTLNIRNDQLTGWTTCRFDESAQIPASVSPESGIADGTLVGTTGAIPTDRGDWEWMVVDHNKGQCVALPCRPSGEVPSTDALNVVAMHGSHAVKGRGLEQGDLTRVGLPDWKRRSLTIHGMSRDAAT